MRHCLIGFVYHTIQTLAWMVLRLGFGLKVEGRHYIPRHGGFVLASNHLSYLDPVVVAVACTRRLVFVARADLFEVPWLGPFLRFVQTIPIQRHDTDVSLREAVRWLRRGLPVAIFPEGGRQFSGTLGAAKPGVGLLAATAQAPIVPVLVQGTFEALPPTAHRIRLAKIRVAFGPQIRYSEELLSDEIYDRLAQQVTASWHRLAVTTHGTH